MTEPPDHNDRPRISVVTPSLNQGEFLEACIQSVLDQGYPNLEYIIVDGGSNDGSVDIIRKFEGHLAHWVSEPDEGQSHAINKGLRSATGELVTWLNADDFLYPGALQAMADAWLADPNASFYWGNGNRVDRDGAMRFRHYPDADVFFDRNALIEGLNYILQPATFMNRTVLESVGFLDESLHYGMDSDLWIRLSASAEPVRVSACIAANREYDDTKSLSGSFERVEELRRLAERYSGDPMTPGALWYYLHTLHDHMLQNPKSYPKGALQIAASHWHAVEMQMAKKGRICGIFPARMSAWQRFCNRWRCRYLWLADLLTITWHGILKSR
jgi:glycosyltransferase involved in cell wall biosynthesis